MERLRQLYITLITGLLTLTACSTDDASEQGVGLQDDGKIRVHLKVGAAGSSEATRGWSDSQYANDAEMMNVWTVVVVNNEEGENFNKVVSIYACKPEGEPDQEIDDIAELPSKGKYRFYSFANMSPTVVKQLLGIDGSMPTPVGVRTRGEGDGNNDPTSGPSTQVEGLVTAYNGVGSAVSESVTSYVTANDAPDPFMNDNTFAKNTYHPIEFVKDAVITADAISAATVNMAGNNFRVSGANGYGAVGIPMSNVQTIEVMETTTSIELIVIRMLAKIELDIYNDGENDATISSISLTDITKNANNNLKLLPSLTAGANSMEFTHKDIQPNLGAMAARGNMTLTPSTASQGFIAKTGHKTTDDPRNPVKFVFYVNESAAPDNGSGLFYVTLGIKTGSGTDVVYSHALINPKGKTSADDNAWNYIARNDYRIIPVVLTDWLFRIEPIALAPIGGYPTPTLSSNGLKATFDTGGMIALQPYVKNRKEDFWRDFSDPEVTFTEIHWTNSDGNDVSGPGKIVKTAFTYDPLTKYIIGELNQDRVTTDKSNRTAITVTVKLGPTGSQFTYNFTCDVAI